MKNERGFLLNTDVILETRRLAMHLNVERFLRESSPDRLFLSVVSLGELRRKARSWDENDPGLAKGVQNWLDEASCHFEDRISPIDSRVMETWSATSDILDGSTAASLIAATAASNNLILVTRNAREAAGMKIRTLNPWHAAFRTRPAAWSGDTA